MTLPPTTIAVEAAAAPVPALWQAPAATPFPTAQIAAAPPKTVVAASVAPTPTRHEGALTQVAPKPWTPPTTAAVAAGYTGPCPANIVALTQRVWGALWRWAVSIEWRESNCQPGARNRSSGAEGLFQLLGHGDLFVAVGCTPEQWADASCNTRAAWRLYQLAGPAPWRL